jgi:ribosomal protein S12 methylthiotransferase
VIRSTFIAGFPGETEEEFEHLLDFMREAEIDRAGCFAYSPVEGATANELPGMLPEEVREARRARFMEVAEEVSTKRLQRRVGQVMKVLVDKAVSLGKRAVWAAPMPMLPRSTAWFTSSRLKRPARPTRWAS